MEKKKVSFDEFATRVTQMATATAEQTLIHAELIKLFVEMFKMVEVKPGCGIEFYNLQCEIEGKTNG